MFGFLLAPLPALAQTETDEDMSWAEDFDFDALPDDYDPYGDFTPEQLYPQLVRARFYRALGSSKRAIDSSGQRCRKNREEVKKAEERYQERKEENDRNPTDRNKRQAEGRQVAIDQKIDEYKICFSNNLRDFGVIWNEGITSYGGHREAHRKLREEHFYSVYDLNQHISELIDALKRARKAAEDEDGCYAGSGERRPLLGPRGISAVPLDMTNQASGLTNAVFVLPDEQSFTWNQGFEDYLIPVIGTEPGDVMGRIDNTQGEVEVLPLGRGKQWRKICKGYKFRLADWIRTKGPRSYARITFRDPVNLDDERTRQTIVLGPNSEISVEKFTHGPSRPKTIIQLMRGKLRAFTKSHGPSSSFRIRTGSSLCGIRGTEVAISYDPDTDKVDYVLDHGDAYYQLNGGPEVSLQPRTGVAITNGRASAPRSISESDWQGFVAATVPAAGFDEALEEVSIERPRPIPPPDTEDLSREEWMRASYRIGARHASLMTDEFLRALKDANLQQIINNSGGDYHEFIRKKEAEAVDLQTYFENSSDRPLTYKVGCTVCRLGGECWTWAKVMPARGEQTVVFITEPSKEGKRVVSSKTWNTDTETAFNQMGEQVCE